MEYLKDLAQTLSANPLICFAVRKNTNFKARFHESITVEQLEKLQNANCCIDFLCGAKKENVTIGTWGHISVKKTEMKQRNIISFDFDKKDNLDRPEFTLPKQSDIWLVVNSGNGFHVHIKTTPIPLETEDDRAKYATLYSKIKTQLQIETGWVADPGASNPARFMRLPGSTNCKKDPIKTKVIFYNKNALLNAELILKKVPLNPLKDVPKREFHDDYRNLVFSQINWERIFSHFAFPFKAKKVGQDFLVSSPFRRDDVSSMSLSSEGLFFDHGDQESSGDAVHFIQKATGILEYSEALTYLGEKIFGVKKVKVTTLGPISKEILKPVTQAKPDEFTEKRIENEKQKKKQASLKDYEILYDNFYGETKLCLFSNEVMFRQKKEDDWAHTLEEKYVYHVKALARESKGYYSPIFASEALKGTYQIYHKNMEREPEFLIEFPAWDEVDRIREITDSIECVTILPDELYEIFCQWGTNLFARIFEPASVRNPVLVLKGPQKTGKDYLVRAMFSSLKQYLIPFVLQSQERDCLDVISSGAVVHVSEFDSLNRAESSMIKRLITEPFARYRSAFARSALQKTIRASWIASVNEDNILRDSTGNSRYWVIDIKKIHYNYPTNESAQVLAQFKWLYENGYQATKKSLIAADLWAKDHTPENFKDSIIEMWEGLMMGKPQIDILEESGGFTLSQISDELEKIERAFKINRNALLSILKTRGYQKRSKKNRLYFATKQEVEPVKGGEDLEIKL